MAWIANNRTFLEGNTPVAQLTLVLVSILTLVVSIAVAYASFRLYDVPVRNWLARRLMSASVKKPA